MNKAELIEKIAKHTGFSKTDSAKFLDALTLSVTKALSVGENITLVGFGTFSITERKARSGRNPKTGAAIKIAASKSPKFKAGQALKAAVNKSKK